MECKHPTKEGMDFVRDALFPLIERLVVRGGGVRGSEGWRWKIGGINGDGENIKLKKEKLVVYNLPHNWRRRVFVFF